MKFDLPIYSDDELNLHGWAGLELSIVVPTFCEAENIPVLITKLGDALAGVRWEVIFVDDDSSDGTAEVIRKLAQKSNNVRCIQRIGRRGLASACIEGALSSSARFVAVMDADLQHDETALVPMMECLQSGDFDIAIGSRYARGGGTGDWNSRRISVSRFATKLTNRLLPTATSDPMSGFFMCFQNIWVRLAPNLSGLGFKILLDIIATAKPPLRIAEVPFEFRSRQHGESKLDNVAAWNLLMLLIDKRVGHLVPARFISFAAVGGFGVAVHMATLGGLFLTGLSFLPAHALATFVAMTSNFFLNNELTYRDKKLRGRAVFRGWLTFCLVSSVGLVSNVGIGGILNQWQPNWIVSAVGGILVGTVWNYIITRRYTWNIS